MKEVFDAMLPFPKKSYFILFLLLIHSNFGISQYGSVHGKVRGSTGENEFNVIIQLDGENQCYSDLDGKYSLDSIPVGSHTIRVRSSFYSDTAEILIEVKEGEDLLLNIEYPYCEYAKNSKKCPICLKSRDAIPIVYGYPSEGLIKQAEEKKVLLRGCIITGCDPKWFCTKNQVEY